MPSRRVAVTTAAGLAMLGVVPLLLPVPPLDGTVPPRDLAGPGSEFADVDLPGGTTVTLHYETAGKADDRPAFLLLHNFFGSTFSWRHVLAPLGERGYAIAYDRPGFGLSERPLRRAWEGRNPYTRHANADLAVGLLDALDVRDVVLVGSSAGGTTAFEIALRHPERVSGLVLVSPAVNGDVGPPGWTRPLLRLPQARRLGPWYLRRLASLGVERLAAGYHDPSKATEDDLVGYRRPLRARHWDVALYETMVAEPPPHLEPRLREIDVPSVVVTGASDATVRPEDSRRTAAALGDGQFVEIPACGHLAMEECPGAVIEAIDGLLGRLP